MNLNPVFVIVKYYRLKARPNALTKMIPVIYVHYRITTYGPTLSRHIERAKMDID